MSPDQPRPLTPDEQRALDDLVPPAEQTGDPRTDLIAAARESFRRRQENSRVGGIVISALHDRVSSWRVIEAETDIPRTTAQRWAEQPLPASARPAGQRPRKRPGGGSP